jgi:hypothetical protein
MALAEYENCNPTIAAIIPTLRIMVLPRLGPTSVVVECQVVKLELGVAGQGA